ncbi:hypothetical protein LCGC14_2329730 [marine sediment metagenome]|uniref:Uncharacterized protein n=1 Tax=marine sediment metagenome TaxID=412755 RepID=A0A0F9CF68_9ZZZZ
MSEVQTRQVFKVLDTAYGTQVDIDDGKVTLTSLSNFCSFVTMPHNIALEVAALILEHCPEETPEEEPDE